MLGAGVAAQEPALPTVRLAPGTVIDRSVRVRPGVYRLPSRSLDSPALVVAADDIAIDLTGVTIEGGEPYAAPDTFTGLGIAIDGRRGVTIRGGTIRGYKVGVLARRSPGLHVTRGDLSYNWKPRLRSGIEQEDLSDWLSFHQNDRDEWLRYGAAIYLSESDDAEIDHVRVVQGMNGLMVTRSARLKVWNSVFSFLSGIGVGLYRTSDSTIMHNQIDWCVRGYSHGFYNRGQDSAGLLMYEQSSRNVVAYNSITHGGDGVFLWAGQTTMDTGQGGANDNVFFDNDLSHAVANGIEATFSRNVIVGNRIDDSWHGIWGGYSYDTVIAANRFAGNTEGIAIEHGQNIAIRDNLFIGDGTAVRLWANTRQDPNWGYPRHRDTRSRDYELRGNRFERVTTAIDVMRTTGIRIGNNEHEQVVTPIRQGPDVEALIERPFTDDVAPAPVARPRALAAGIDAKLPPGARRGRASIIVDEWGPYDYRSPKLWPVASPGDRPLRLRVLGPVGRWTLESIRGASAASRQGAVPGEIVVTPSGRGADFEVTLEYRGGQVVTPRGQVTDAGRPYQFSYALFDPAIAWTVQFWKFDAGSHPLEQPAAFQSLLASAPSRTERTARLAFPNARAFGEGYTERVAITAEGEIDLRGGRYELSVTSDDGIRVWLDGRLVLEDWTIHAPKEDRVPIAGGRHRLKLEYFQNTGAAALQVKVVRR
jgi:nitrous oxidase accessory protein NosD